MCARFERRDGTLRREGHLHLPGTVAHLWPFARALVATLDLAGISPGLTGFDPRPVLTRRLRALERYWDALGPAYASDPPGRPLAWLGGGDVYYDDNAWVALALVQLELLGLGGGRPDRVAQIAAFAHAGWSPDAAAPSPGGIFWVEQGRGLGTRNHDRNTVSSAPNAQAMIHLAALRGDPEPRSPGPDEIGAWVRSALDSRGDGGGLFWDKVRGDGTIDRARWSYNQGSMLGLDALLSDRGGAAAAAHLRRSERIAHRALDHYSASGYAGEPAEFIAILVRNLLALHARTGQAALRARIETTLRERAAATWPVAPAATLLEHAAAASLQALAAWDPADYRRIA